MITPEEVRVSGVSRTEQIAADPNRVIVFDTTMRDGEQAPGFSMSAQAKVKMAQVLRDLGVDVIEAGFAAASPGDEDCIRRVAGEVEGPIFCSLSRANEKDIDATFRALEPAPKSHRRCHTFIGTSPIHRTAKLKMSTNEVLSTAVRSVEYARSLFDDVEFSAEDAFRTEPEFLADVLEAAADAGARTLNVPDTVGYATPEEVRERFATLAARIKKRHPHVIFSAHCHDDLGMAVANSLAAVEGGARQIEGAINGIGERAGNCSIEEVIMALKVREDRYGVTTGADSRHLVRASKILCEITATSRWSASTPSPTRRESTSTACWPTAAPMRSCGPRMWASRAAGSCWASTRAVTLSPSAPRPSAVRSRASVWRRWSRASSRARIRSARSMTPN